MSATARSGRPHRRAGAEEPGRHRSATEGPGTHRAANTGARLRRSATGGARPRRSGEWLVFTAATLVALAHALDDAFVHRGPGLGAGEFVLAAALALAAGLAGVLAFPVLRPGLRAALAVGFGVLAGVNGAMHLHHLRAFGAAGADVTGVLAFAAGVLLLGLAVAIPWRHRGERPRRRWARRGLAATAALLGALFLLGPVSLGIVETHKWREPVGAAPGGYAEVAFRASDGLRLAGWYRPSRNGAAVLIVHGGGSDRRGSLAHARLLARRGYGVLLYDARGRGESEGGPNNFGWGWPKDVEGALAYLRGRPGIDPARIGALGLSTGADVLVEVAAERGRLAALVTDGAAAGSFEDWRRLRGTEPGLPPGWVMFTTMRLLSSDPPGPPLEDLIARVASPTLLISAGTADERDFNVLYDAAARGPVEHWNLPGAQHTEAIHSHAAAYERRVTRFFAAALR
jgi:predicted alpha/beta hydrolase